MLKIGGVREYFNLPWDICFEEGRFLENGVQATWEDCLGGTGEMLSKLRAAELDIAIVLTEGIVSDIFKGNPSKIIQFFVNSPLIWGIHVPIHSSIKSIKDIAGKKYAISRHKSGSHLMAYVNAYRQNIKINKEDFIVVKNLDGARESMRKLESEVFFWEKHTTQPFVDNGEFRRISDFSAPWPCFAIAVREEVLEKKPTEIKTILNVVLATAEALIKSKDTKEKISQRFELEKEKVGILWDKLEWNTTRATHLDAYERVITSLQNVGILDNKIKYDSSFLLRSF